MIVFIFWFINIFASNEISYFQKFTKNFYKVAPTDFYSRINHLVHDLENKSYIASPLGEGVWGKFDQGVIARIDGFDCQTYVETVLAISMSKDYESSINLLQNIRYFKKPSYFTRNHFVSLDWAPNAIDKGILFNIDNKYVKKHYKSTSQLIDKRGWINSADTKRIRLKDDYNKEEVLRELKSRAKYFEPKKVSVEFIPFASFFVKDKVLGKIILNYKLINNLPKAMVAAHVRVNWYLPKLATNMIVSHMGLIYKNNKKWFYTEASSVQGKVIVISLEDFLKKMINNKKISGLYVLKINDKWLLESAK